MIEHPNSIIPKPSLFEIAGLVTVLVSLFFVGYELRQANKIARVETEKWTPKTGQCVRWHLLG